MPAYLSDIYWLYLLWPMVVFVALVGGALVTLYYCLSLDDDGTKARIVAISTMAFALIGMVTGFMTGLSREPVVGAVIPAVLSLVGGLGIYLNGRGDDGPNFLVPGSVAALALSILVGALWGAEERGHWNQMEAASAQVRQSPEYLVRQAEVEAYVRMHRRQLGLPESPPITPQPASAETAACSANAC